MYQLGNLDLVSSDVCRLWNQSAQDTFPPVFTARSLAWCQSYDCIEQVLKALLAYEGVVIKGSWMYSASASYHKRILEAFDDENSMFHECLGQAAEQHIVRFRREDSKPPPNGARMAMERLRIYEEWYQSFPRSSTRLRQSQKTLPNGENLRKGYTTITHALVKALSLCIEGAQRNSVTSHDNHRWVDPAKRERAPTIISNQLALSSSGNGTSDQSYQEWDLIQSPSKLSPPTLRQPIPVSATSQTMKRVLDKMKADKDCKATISPPATGATTTFQQVVQTAVSDPLTRNTRAPDAPSVPVLNPCSRIGDRKRVTASATSWARGTPDKSTEILTTIKEEAGVLIERKLAEHISLLNQELENERTSREVEKRGHIAYITKLNHKLTKAKKNFGILLENDHRYNKALKAADVSKAELQKALKDAAKAKEDAEWGRYIARNKLEMTLEENASLKKDVEKAREKGRDDIRAQVSGALSGILSP